MVSTVLDCTLGTGTAQSYFILLGPIVKNRKMLKIYGSRTVPEPVDDVNSETFFL